MGKYKQEENLTLPANLTELNRVLDMTKQMMESVSASAETVKAVQISIEELFVNICSYAYSKDYKGKKDCDVRWFIEADDNLAKLTICLKDHGTPFDPVSKDDPDIDPDIDVSDRKVGGLGVFMVKGYMDKIEYEYKNKQNIVSIEKEWPIDTSASYTPEQ